MHRELRHTVVCDDALDLVATSQGHVERVVPEASVGPLVNFVPLPTSRKTTLKPEAGFPAGSRMTPVIAAVDDCANSPGALPGDEDEAGDHDERPAERFVAENSSCHAISKDARGVPTRSAILVPALVVCQGWRRARQSPESMMPKLLRGPA